MLAWFAQYVVLEITVLGRVVDVVGDSSAWVIPLVADRERIPPEGKLRVWRTTDGGATWRPVADALPAPRVSPFPAVFQDVSLIVDDAVAAADVLDVVRSGAGELLESVELFDVYTGPQIGEGRKSLTLALRFRALDRTLTEDEASAARDAAVAAAAGRLGAVQRA